MCLNVALVTELNDHRQRTFGGSFNVGVAILDLPIQQKQPGHSFLCQSKINIISLQPAVPFMDGGNRRGLSGWVKCSFGDCVLLASTFATATA